MLAAMQQVLVAVPGIANPTLGDEAVIFKEAHKHAAEQPRHGCLCDLAVAPSLIRGGSSGAGPRYLVLLTESGIQSTLVGETQAHVLLQHGHERVQIGQQPGSVDHAVVVAPGWRCLLLRKY